MSDAYYGWLIGLISDGYMELNYQNLLWKLYSTDFYYELAFDENRAADGLYLRKMYFRETGFSVAERPCSVLEMMIALAKKAEDDIMHNPDFGDRSGYWFWTMIQNLGLDMYDDSYFFESEVDKILDIFVHRRYENNGFGGAFPVHNKTRDVRKTDLWWQMNAYLEENFPV